MQDDPKLAEQFLQGVMNGNIKAHDVKDLNALLDEAVRISDGVAKGKIKDPDAKSGFESALDRFGNAAKNITSILAIASSIAAVGTVLHQRQNDTNRAQAEIYDRRVRAQELTRNTRNNPLTRGELDNIWTQAGIDARTNRGPFHQESASDNTNFDNSFYVSEAADFSSIIQKITSFFSDHAGFCKSAIDKISDLQKSLQEKLKNAKSSEDASAINTALAGLRNVMSAITKELNNTKNMASKLFEKFTKKDKE
jgi:hypothetical protein